MRMGICPWCGREDIDIDMATRVIAPHNKPVDWRTWWETVPCTEPSLVEEQPGGYIWTVGSAGLPTLGKHR